jgi:hypothetical protein
MRTTKGADDRPPPGGKIWEEGQGKEEGSVSADNVHHTAVQVDAGDAAFLLMVEATVATPTTLSSTVVSRVLLLLGVGTMTIILGLLLP